MSSTMPGADGSTLEIRPENRARRSVVDSDGLTTTTPRTADPRVSARRSARQPPTDRPRTTTWSQRSCSSTKLRWASANQSCQMVRLASCQRVPWPGSRGTDTVRPSRREVLGPRPDAHRRAAEAVQHQGADRTPVEAPGLCALQHGHGHLLTVGIVLRWSHAAATLCRAGEPPVRRCGRQRRAGAAGVHPFGLEHADRSGRTAAIGASWCRDCAIAQTARCP